MRTDLKLKLMLQGGGQRRYSMLVNVKGGNVWQQLATTGKVSLGKVACLGQAAADDLINGRIDVGDAVIILKLNFS